MEINNINRSIHAHSLSLEKLENSSQLSEQEKVSEVSRQFEAIFLRQVLNDAQKPMLNSALAQGGSSAAIYQGIMVERLADDLSQSRSFGLSQIIEQALTIRSKSAEDSTSLSTKPQTSL